MSVSEMAKAVYESDLRSEMERGHWGMFIAIEPESRRYFLGETFIEVALMAKNQIPDKMSFVIKVGERAAVHIGGASSQ
ncbi:MAG: hypothetical protein AAF394_00205 [Planctomycetota bacterium]